MVFDKCSSQLKFCRNEFVKLLRPKSILVPFGCGKQGDKVAFNKDM